MRSLITCKPVQHVGTASKSAHSRATTAGSATDLESLDRWEDVPVDPARAEAGYHHSAHPMALSPHSRWRTGRAQSHTLHFTSCVDVGHLEASDSAASFDPFRWQWS